MKHLARMLALAGLVLAVILFAREDVRSIVALVLAAGPGLLVAALFHVLPILANARAWGKLLPAAQRPSVRVLAAATWVRESVNGLLPVARIGGEIVAYRLVRRLGVRRSDAAASLVADMALSVLSQAAFALLGLALLFASGVASTATARLIAAVLGMIALGAAFVVVQRAGALGAATRVLDRLFAGRLGMVHAHSLRFDEALRGTYARHRDVVACLAWQLGGWVLGAGEIWLALFFLGQTRSVLDAIVIEALIQALASAAFIVPGALGVQEAGFIMIGAALGIDATTALALATARRLRDVSIFFPGLLAWQWAEMRRRGARSASTARGH
jgi:putative membrane protein